LLIVLHALDIPNAIVIVYDPLVTTQGSLSLKAYRLSDRFLKLQKEKKFTSQAFVPPCFDVVFEYLRVDPR